MTSPSAKEQLLEQLHGLAKSLEHGEHTKSIRDSREWLINTALPATVRHHPGRFQDHAKAVSDLCSMLALMGSITRMLESRLPNIIENVQKDDESEGG